MSNIIDKIQLSGVTYDIGGSGSVSTAITSGDTNAVAGGAVYDRFDEVEQVTAAALNDINDRVSEDEEVTAAALNALNTNKQDKLSAGTGISISGNVISATGGGGGNPTVELTQAEYDALVSAGTVSADTYYIITDATPVDMANYYTTAQTNTLLAGKQDALSAGRGISISSNTVDFTLPISAGTGTNAIKENYSINNASGTYSHAEGYNTTASAYYAHTEGSTTTASGEASHAEGSRTTANTLYAHAEGALTLASGTGSHAEGYNTTASGSYSHAEGRYATAQNEAEHASGRYNVSSKANTTFGDSGNTLFSVGNGASTSARHNAFEIRQNGDIYISSGGTDIKLQDSLGGTVSSAITSGDTNAVAGGAVYDRFDEVEQVTAQALNVLNDRVTEDEEVTAAALNNLNEALSGKQDTLSAGTGISIIDNVISATGGGGGGTVESAITSGSTNAVESKAIWSATTYNKDVLLTFNGYNSTNYPQGCTKLKVEDITNHSNNNIIFNDNGVYVGRITINNFDSISVENYFDGATYEIDGTTVIISYPTITNITSINVSDTGNYVFKAIVEGAWIADSTYMKSEVDAIQNTLQNNINSKLDATAYTPTVVDSALNVASVNPVQNQALYSELRIGNGGEAETTLVFDSDGVSTNYPNGCTRLIVEIVGNNNGSIIGFIGDWALGTIYINNYGSISVDASNFQGATYEISGTTVIISYPTVTNVTRIQVNAYSSNYTYKAVTTGAPTALKDQVVANTTALGGLSLVKLTQAQYDALANKDNSTLYVIVG